MTVQLGGAYQHLAGLAARKSKDTLSNVDAQSIFPVHCRSVNIFWDGQVSIGPTSCRCRRREIGADALLSGQDVQP